MSKAEGKSIVIKFTEDLVGDVAGNIEAITATGQQYKYIKGSLLDKSYIIAAVGRPATVPLWALGEPIQLAGSNIMEDFEDATISEGISLTGSWIRSSASAQTGTYSLTSPNKNHSSTSESELTFTSTVGTPFSIGYMVSSEINYDKFSLFHNNVVVVNAISGSSGWQTYAGTATEGVNVLKLRYTKDGSASAGLDAGFVGNLSIPGEYSSPIIYITESIALAEQCRVVFTETNPVNTSILIEYTTGEVQGAWQEVSNGDVITPNINLWFRATLETTDLSVTPILHDLWIEETTVPQDIIVLTVEPFNNFNNVEGNLTVNYDVTKGNLSGRGGAVESFENVFLPTDLIQTPNPNVEEYVSVAPVEVVADLLDIEYPKAYGDMGTITVAPFEVTATLLDVEDINP